MKNKFVRLGIAFIAFVLFIASVWNFYTDINYFITKREGYAKVLSIKEEGNHSPYKIKLLYENEYLTKLIECEIELKKSDVDILKESNLRRVKIFYGREMPHNIYLAEHGAPKTGVVFFDLIMILLMGLAVYVNIGRKRE